MAEYVLLEQKDKVILRRNREGEYGIAEVVIHDEDTNKLFARANSILRQLKEGRIPVIEPERQKRFVCTICGYEVPVLNPEQPNIMRLPCPKCNKWVNFEKR